MKAITKKTRKVGLKVKWNNQYKLHFTNRGVWKFYAIVLVWEFGRISFTDFLDFICFTCTASVLFFFKKVTEKKQKRKTAQK